MVPVEIQKHNFEKQKQELQQFSQKLPPSVNFEKFEVDGGLFYLGDHYINGNEMNRFVSKLQSLFIQRDDSLRSVIKEFSKIYNTFDTLDKEYIEGIVRSLQAASRSLQEAEDAQAKISRTIDALQTTVNALKIYKGETETKFIDIKATTDELQATANALKQHKEVTETKFTDIKATTDGLQSYQNYFGKNLKELSSKLLHLTDECHKRNDETKQTIGNVCIVIDSLKTEITQSIKQSEAKNEIRINEVTDSIDKSKTEIAQRFFQLQCITDSLEKNIEDSSNRIIAFCKEWNDNLIVLEARCKDDKKKLDSQINAVNTKLKDIEFNTVSNEQAINDIKQDIRTEKEATLSLVQSIRFDIDKTHNEIEQRYQTIDENYRNETSERVSQIQNLKILVSELKNSINSIEESINLISSESAQKYDVLTVKVGDALSAIKHTQGDLSSVRNVTDKLSIDVKGIIDNERKIELLNTDVDNVRNDLTIAETTLSKLVSDTEKISYNAINCEKRIAAIEESTTKNKKLYYIAIGLSASAITIVIIQVILRIFGVI